MPHRFQKRLEEMCDAAFCALMGTLRLSCTMLLCSFAILVHIGGLSAETHDLYRLAMELAASPAGLLLVACIVSVLLEEKSLGQR